MISHTTVSLLAVAISCSAVTWWAKMLAQQGGVLELVQLGGTGGLIVSLFGAVVALWKDRAAMNRLLKDERAAHREEIARLQSKHRSDVQAATDQLMDELRSQIASLKQDTAAKYKRLDEGCS